jgi:protein-tyrosine kinase
LPVAVFSAEGFLMSMIEQASKRLEQLGQAGFTVPTSVSRLRVVDDADAQIARRRVALPARTLSDAAQAENASGAADAPVHFSPALTPTFARAAVAAVAPAVDAPNAVAPVEPIAKPVAEPVAAASAASAETVHPVLADVVPASDPTAFFAPFAEAESLMRVDARGVHVTATEPAWFDETLAAETVVAPLVSAASVMAPVAIAAAVAAPTIAPAVSPTSAATVAPTVAQTLAAEAPVRLAVAQAPGIGMVVDASLAQRSEPATRVSFDLERLRGVGYLVPDQVRSEMAEQFRHLKRPLLKNARAKTGPTGLCSSHIMITSALPGEGKTFSSINLAMSMAMEVDTAVLLIDADVVRPSVFNRLGINIKPPGLLDLLTRDDLPLHEALVSTNVPKLTLMASGERNQRSTELLASTAMDKLLARLAVEYPDHVVIFDAPPLLLTNESPVLATKVGQVVVVVEALKTRRTVIQQAFAALKNCPVVHSVLNKCDEATEGRRYGYYYG